MAILALFILCTSVRTGVAVELVADKASYHIFNVVYRTEKEEALLRHYYEQVYNTILVHQHPVTGLLPSFFDPSNQSQVCVS